MSSPIYIPILTVAMLALVIGSVRVVGLRSFSKMSSFDFAVTVSIGSILGSVASASTSTSLLKGALAIASLLCAQAAVSWARTRRYGVQKIVDNTPLLLMDGPELLGKNLEAARVTKSDVMAKLREANVCRLADVRAVVLETTGDISVIHGPHPIDSVIMEGLRGVWE